MRKRGAVDWTIGKLLRLVLLVLVLALVAYGVSTQSLNPLIESIGGKIDEVKIMLHLKEDIYSKECYVENIVDLGGGKEFLKEIGMEGKDVVLNVCKNRICNISSRGAVSYRVREGEFERMGLSEWTKYDSAFVGDLSFIKFSWELYNAGMEILDKPKIKALYDKGFTRKFILYGDGSGKDLEIYAIWQNGKWKIMRGYLVEPNTKDWVKRKELWVSKTGGITINETERFRYVENDDEAIDWFAEEAREGYDDWVFWKETIPIKPDEEYVGDSGHGESIFTLIGRSGKFNNYEDKLDSDKEVAMLKEEFAKRKRGYLDEAKVSNKELSEVLGESIIIADKEYDINIEEDGELPIVSFDFGKEKYGFRHSVYAKVNSDILDGTKLRYFPVSLVEWNSRLNKWEEFGNEEYYRLYKKDFEEVRRATLISQFLESKCK